jgi:hypothetical protein
LPRLSRKAVKPRADNRESIVYGISFVVVTDVGRRTVECSGRDIGIDGKKGAEEIFKNRPGDGGTR